MKPNWNISYEICRNNQSPVEPILLFEIPIADNQVVYMEQAIYKRPFCDEYIVILDTQKFIHAWQQSKNDAIIPNYHLGDKQLWRNDSGFAETEAMFKRGKAHPHQVIHGVFYQDNDGIGFSDSITRTIWLLANDAEYLPVATRTLQKAQVLQQVAGRENCNIAFCGDMLTAYFQTLPYPHQGLTP